MYYIGRTPLDKVVKQALCLRHTEYDYDGEVSLLKGRIGFVFDEEALAEAVKVIKPDESAGLEYTPSLLEYTRALMSVHFLTYDEGFHDRARDDDARLYKDDNRKPMFPPSKTEDGDIFYTLYFNDCPIEMLAELGISKDKVLFYDRAYQLVPGTGKQPLEAGIKETPNYEILDGNINIHHPEAFMSIIEGRVEYKPPFYTALPEPEPHDM